MTRMSDVAATAKCIRREIRIARNNGALNLPTDAKVSVRSDNTGLNATIHVTISNAPDDWTFTTRPGNFGTTDVTPSEAAKTAAKTIADIIRTTRGDLGWIWGTIRTEHTMLESVPSAGWAPGRD